MPEDYPRINRVEVGIMDASDQSTNRLGELRVSARGWHGVQLGVLGFIGLCGVLEQNGGNGNPGWLQVLVGLLVLYAFGLACAATVLVALAAWPIYAPGSGTEGTAGEIARTSSRLRAGITLTFVSVAVLALATSSAWWPSDTGGENDATAIEVRTRAGLICGDLGEPSGQGLLAVSAGGRLVELTLSDVISVQPVDDCR